MNTKNKKGFSLIEILIVVTIIGILMAIIMPAYQGVARRGRSVKCQANLKNLYTASMLYVKNHNRYPNAISRVWLDDDNSIDHVLGWVHWSTDKSWEEVYNNFSLGVTRWSGEDGLFCVTNGSIWSYTGKSIESYSCPEFKLLDFDDSNPPDKDKIYRSYVYNRAIDWVAAANLRRMSSTLMFGEGAQHVLTANNGNHTGEGWENENKWDGCFQPGKYKDRSFSAGRNNETLGHYHKDETSFIVFCDGHIERLRKTGYNPKTKKVIPAEQLILFDLCEGKFLDREDF